MSRIRSIHPDIFTDEAFVEISFPARLLLLGLGTEADDQGVFQWKPTALRLKIFPGDAVDVQDLLKELTAVEFVKRFKDDGGREFGAVRNFCEHQKPKRPNAKHPLPKELFGFVKLHENRQLASLCGEHVPNHSRTGSPGEERRGGESSGEEGRGEELRSEIVPTDALGRFVEHRKRRDGKSPGDYAISRMVAKLERLANDGHDPTAVIDQSIENNWAGLFELKGNANGNGNRGGSNGLLDACKEQ